MKLLGHQLADTLYNFQQKYFGVRRDYLEKQAKLLSIVNRDNNEE